VPLGHFQSVAQRGLKSIAQGLPGFTLGCRSRAQKTRARKRQAYSDTVILRGRRAKLHLSQVTDLRKRAITSNLEILLN
jgi:hypothetical protein